jgi:DNA-binding LytR/AlgR family response regulator
MIRVLLCDDHRIVREGLRQVLADDADIMVCGEARTGTEALAQVQALMGAAAQGDRTGLDVVLLDIAMPGMRRSRRSAGHSARISRPACADAEHLPGKAVRGALHPAWCGGLSAQERRSPTTWWPRCAKWPVAGAI